MSYSTKNNKVKAISKSLLLAIVFIATTFTSQAQNETSGNTVTVKVNNIKNTNGKILSSLHDVNTFMSGKDGLQNAEAKITGDSIIITYKNVIAGEYAIMGVHDENDNKQMDFELNGMPKESYGMSNNPILYGPPTFDVAKFTVKDEDVNIIINF